MVPGVKEKAGDLYLYSCPLNIISGPKAISNLQRRRSKQKLYKVIWNKGQYISNDSS